MLLVRPLRLPLSTGASPVNLALGLGIIGCLGALPLFISSLLPNFVAVICGLLMALWFLALVTLPWTVVKRRASDVEFDTAGLRVVAGPHSGRSVTWQELLQAPPQLRSNAESCELQLAQDLVIASSELEEMSSLANLHQSAQALAEGKRLANAEAKAFGSDARVPLCSACGAPLTPSDAATVRCRHCGIDAPLPTALRYEVQKLNLLTRARSKTRRALEVLTRWPSAQRVNGVFAIAVVPLVLGWPLAGGLSSEFFQYRDVFSWRDVFVLFTSTAALTLGSCFWLQAQLVHRQALGLVVATFHAVRVGNGLGCRHCGAPLPVAPDTPLIACAFCREDNVVLGLDLPPRVIAETVQANTLDALLTGRLRSLRRWQWLSALAATLVLLGAGLLFEPLQRAATSHAPSHEAVDRPWSYPGPTGQR